MTPILAGKTEEKEMTKMVNKNSSCRILFAVLLAAVMLAGGKASSANDDPLAKHPPGRMAVSVLWFENRAGEDAEHWRYGLKGPLSAALKKVKAIRLNSGVGYARRELGIEKGSALNAGEARKIGEIVEAQRVVWGSYQGSSNSWQVTAFLLNVASGEVSDPITASGTDWFDIRNALTQQILEQLRINPSEEESQKFLRRETHSLQALEWRVKSHAYQAKGSPLSIQEDASRQAVAADAQYAEAYVDLSAQLASQGKLDEAEICLRHAVEIKPDLASAHRLLGTIHLFKSQNKQALRELQEALRLDPENTETLVRLSEFHTIKEQWEQATTYAEEAIALAPLDASMHAHLGLIYVNRHKREQAMRELKEAERLMDPDNAVQKIGTSYRLLGEIPLAVEHYEKFVAQARKVGQNPEAVASFDKTLQRMKATLTPTFVEAEMPRVYTEETLQEALRKNLAPAERAMLVNPVAGNPEISRWARQLTAGTTNEIDKARAIFDELIQRIQVNGGYGKRTAREVFAAWDDPDQAFSCQEFAKLYLVLARDVGINAFYVHLGRDYRGKLVFHDCAIVFVDEKALLVDPAYRWFGVPHQEFTVLDDVQTVAHQLFQHTAGERNVAKCWLAARLHPDFAWGQMCLAGALVDNDQPREAIKVLENAERLEPGRWDAHRLRGFMAAKDEDWNAALTHANKTLELNPEDDRTYIILGVALAGLGREEEAREAYRTCLRHGLEGGMADHARRAIAQINERIGAESGEGFETAALMVATKAGRIEAVRQMLAGGADANAQEASGATALMIAAHEGHLDIVELLLSSGADADIICTGGGTAMLAAADPGHAPIIKRLLANGAKVNGSSSMGLTPLLLASQNGHTEVVKLLLEAGAHTDSSEKSQGLTPLYVASQNGHAEVVKLLLDAGVDMNAKGISSKGLAFTPLEIARKLGHEKIVELLQSAQRKRGSRPAGKIEGNNFIDDDGNVRIKSESDELIKDK